MVAMYSHQPWIADTDVAGKADISANGRFDVRSLDHVQRFGLGDYGTNAGNWAGYAMVVGFGVEPMGDLRPGPGAFEHWPAGQGRSNHLMKREKVSGANFPVSIKI